MAAAIKKELELEVELLEGGGGIFDVEADEEVLFSKAVAGRFPEAGEVIALIRGHA